MTPTSLNSYKTYASTEFYVFDVFTEKHVVRKQILKTFMNGTSVLKTFEKFPYPKLEVSIITF